MASPLFQCHPMDTKPLSQELLDLIPIEIYDSIISHISSTSALKNCSLTCKAWLQASWRNLFSRRTIVVDCNNFEAFLQLIELDTQSITIIRYIRFLHIEQGDSRLLYRSTGPRNPQSFQFDDFLPRFVGLASVKTLELGWIRRDIGPTTISALRNNFGGVSALELNSVVLPAAGQLLDILLSFPSLSSLTLAGVQISRCSDEPYNSNYEWDQTILSLHPPPKLTELSCNLPRDETIFIFSWLTAHGISSIRKLTVTLIHELSNIAISGYLFEFGLALEELMIGNVTQIIPQKFDLPPCTNLKTLSISIEYRVRSSVFSMVLELVPPRDILVPLFNILDTVSTDHLNEVKIRLRPNGHLTEEDYAQFDWEGLASVIKHPRFANLTKFKLVAPHKHCETVRRVIAKQIWEVHSSLVSVIRVHVWGGPKRMMH
ncbi:hypothetical protein EV360DRAFT_79416 [Lentinula raphanica]|nr:hypothetical protein EV360DRAFT_79416 [Lentinula raphanica]